MLFTVTRVCLEHEARKRSIGLSTEGNRFFKLLDGAYEVTIELAGNTAMMPQKPRSTRTFAKPLVEKFLAGFSTRCGLGVG